MDANLNPHALGTSFCQLRTFVFGLILLAGLECGVTAAIAQSGPPPEIAGFITNKEAQARALAKELELRISPDVWAYFKTAKTGNASAVTNAFERLKKRANQYEGSRNDPSVGTPVWQTLIEVELGVEGFADGDPKYSLAFGHGVIASIPAGSIYFGGTDPGRGLVTALCRSHADGDPFFTVTQNALADNRYLEYLRAMYGRKIKIPTDEESQAAFQEYLADAQKRHAHDTDFPNEPRQIKPGEDVRIVDNRVQVSGQIAVMAINALLVKNIFDNNPGREFFIEESFPLEWMYPHLLPHQFILKLDRKPVADLPETILQRDREFWTKQQAQLIGDWLTLETPVSEVCAFAAKVYGRKDLSGFKGDRRFVKNEYAMKLYSKLRSSIGGVYVWRLSPNCPSEFRPRSAEHLDRLRREADFTFRQAFAFCPFSPEAVFRYVQLLLQFNRIDDALLVAETCEKLDPKNDQVSGLVRSLKQQQTRIGAPNAAASLAAAETEWEKNPDNFQNGLNLAALYAQRQQFDRANEVLDAMLLNPKVDAKAVLAISQAYAQLQNLPKLEAALKRLTKVSPDSPEAWYDLAALEASLDKPDESIKALTRALDLAAKRKATDPKARDLVVAVRKDARFKSIRSLPEFQKLVPPE